MFCLMGVFVCCCQVILMSPCAAEEIVLYSTLHKAHQELMFIHEQQADEDMIEQAAHAFICVFTRVHMQYKQHCALQKQ